MPYTVDNLIKGQPQPVTASPDEPLREALARMIEYDYSQLPVVDSERRVLGMITSDSIVRALHHFSVATDDLRVAAAMLRVGTRESTG